MSNVMLHLNIEEEGKKSRLVEQEQILRENSLEKILDKYKILLENANEFEKDVLARGDVLMVAGALKSATDIEIPHLCDKDMKQCEINAEKYTSNLRNNLNKINLKLSGITQTEIIKESGDKVDHCFVYNPKLLTLKTQESRFLIPFGEDDDLNLWIEKNRDIGVDRDLILGTLYGFPESSIEFYIFYKKATHEEHLRKDFGDAAEKELAEKALKEERGKIWHLIENYGEAYAISDPKNLESDVLAHEQMKKEFFEKLEANKEFWELFQKIKQEAEL